MEAIFKFLDIYRQKGLLIASKQALRKVIRLLFDTNSAFWFERDFSQPLLEIKPKIPVEINLFSKDETIDWLKNKGEPWMFNQHEIEVGLEENHYFPNVKYQGEIIGYAKAGLGKVYIQDYKKILSLSKECAFIYDTYVAPLYRRQNIATFMLTEIIKFLKSIGIKKIGCHIPPWNTASINAYTKVGFKKVKYISYFKILGIKFFFKNE